MNLIKTKEQRSIVVMVAVALPLVAILWLDDFGRLFDNIVDGPPINTKADAYAAGGIGVLVVGLFGLLVFAAAMTACSWISEGE